MLKLMKCLVPSKGNGVNSPERLITAAVTPTDVSDKPHQESQPLQNSTSRQQSPRQPLEDQNSAEPIFTEAPDSTKDSPAVDSRGVWHVHVQASATSSQAATPPAVAKPRDTIPSVHTPQSIPTPVATRADSACTAAPTLPHSILSSRDALSPQRNGSLAAATVATGGTASAVPSSAQGNSMPLPQLRIRVPKSNVRQLESLSQGRDAVSMHSCRSTQSRAQDACDTDSALARRSTGDRVVSKHSTASASSAASAGSELQNIPLVCPRCSRLNSYFLVYQRCRIAIVQQAMAPQEAPQDDEQHALLAKDVGVATDHEAFVLWRLTQHLGAGAFSKVLLAKASGALRKDLPRTCVIKVVNLGDDCKIRSDYKPVLRAEGLALQRFSFPGFVHCYAVWGSAPEHPEEKAPSHLVLALEHLCGGMLLDRLKKGPLTEHHAAAAFHQIVTCLLYMHHTGYLHRDLKPDNVMLTYDWDPETDGHLPPPVKLIDLGMVLNYVKQPNETGLMGSPGYMSPEAIRGHRHTPQMDMFSLGVLLFVMLTGCKPIPSAVCTKLCYDRMDTSEYPGVKMSQFRRLSAPARDLTLALMARRPASRPSAMAVLSHPWMTSHAERWYSEGVDLRDLAIPRADLAEVIRRNPRVDELLARARAARPPPQVLAARAATACGNNASVGATPPTGSAPLASATASTTTPAERPHGSVIAPSEAPRKPGPYPPGGVFVSVPHPAERSLSGSKLPLMPSEHLRQLGYGEERQQSHVGSGFRRTTSGTSSVSAALEERRHGQENISAQVVQPLIAARAPLKPRNTPGQFIKGEPKTPRTRIPLAQHTPTQLNKRLSVHGSFSNSGALPGGYPGPTPHNTPNNNQKSAIRSTTGTTTQMVQPSVTHNSSRGRSALKQPGPARSLSDTVDNIFELISQQSGGTAPSHSNSAVSGPLTAPTPALLYKKGSSGSGHGPLRTRGSTHSGSLPMPDMTLPSPRLCMHGEDPRRTPRASDAHHSHSHTTGLCRSNSTPTSGPQVPLPPLAPFHRRMSESIGHIPQKCPTGTVFRPSAAAAMSPPRRRFA